MTPVIIYNDEHIYENLIHAGLSPQEATVYIEVEIDGNSIISTADQIEVSPQAVSNALRKAKNKIALYKITIITQKIEDLDINLDIKQEVKE